MARRYSLFAGLAMVAWGAAGPASAAEITVLAAGAVQSTVVQIADTFKKQTGHEIKFTFGTVGALLAKIEAGERADAVILTPAAIDRLIGAGTVRAGTRTDVGQVGMGVAVRAGAYGNAHSHLADIGSRAGTHRAGANQPVDRRRGENDRIGAFAGLDLCQQRPDGPEGELDLVPGLLLERIGDLDHGRLHGARRKYRYLRRARRASSAPRHHGQTRKQRIAPCHSFDRRSTGPHEHPPRLVLGDVRPPNPNQQAQITPARR